MRRALTLLAALALGAAPLPAGATTVPTLTLAQQAKKADVIVRATLGTASSVKEGEVTWLVYPLTITETVAGDPASLPQREGKPALYLLSGLEGLPELRGGQEAFLLLYSRRLDSPVVGLWQGVYPIENGKVTRPASSLAPAAASQVAALPPTAAQTPQTATAPATPATSAAIPTPNPTGTAPTGTAPIGTATPAAPTPPAGTGSGTPPTTPAPAPTAPTPPATAASTPAAASTAPAAANTTASTASTPVPTPLDAIGTDPARFRDALRAARGAR